MKNFQLKQLNKFLFTLLCAFTCSIFTACNGNGDEPEEKDFLIGTWKNQFSDDGFVYYTFLENGTGRVYENDGGSIDQDETFTYIHYPNECRFKYFEEDEYQTVSYEKISDTRLVVYDFSDDVEHWVKQ